SHDFGKDIIPAMLRDDHRLFAYRFEGYWKDVGTIQSYWEANMDLLDEDLQLSCHQKNHRIFSRESNIPPAFIGETAEVTNSLVNAGSFVDGKVDTSIISENVIIEKGSSVHESVIHHGVTIEENVILDRVIVMEGLT